MKSLALAAATSLFFASSAAQAQDDLHFPTGLDTGGFAVKATSALDQIEDLVLFGLPVTGGICTFEDTVGTLPIESAMRARMSRLLEDFRARSERAFIGFQDVAALRTEYVQARIDDAMDDLYKRAVGGGWSRQEYADKVEEWVQRSRVFADAPDPADYRERFRQAIKQPIQDAKSVARLHQSMQANYMEKRVQWAIDLAMARMAEASLEAADKQRVLDLIEKWRLLVGEPKETDPKV
ncbi:MAG: hypothetical protein AAF957_10560 [Planctomycetota bacterium]